MRDIDDRYKKLSGYAARLDADGVIEVVDTILETETNTAEIFHTLRRATAEVVRMYENGEYFIADLIMAGVIYEAVVRKVVDGGSRNIKRGKIICGVVEGDIHELGKNIVVGILEYNGYEVTDLGVDVSAEEFCVAVCDIKPDTVILSGVLMQSAKKIEGTIRRFSERGLRAEIKVLVGGANISKEDSVRMGADGCIENFIDCLALCERNADREE